MLGETDRASAILEALDRSYDNQTLRTYGPLVSAYFYLGDYDTAFIWLDRLIEDRQFGWFGLIRAAVHLGETVDQGVTL